MNEDIKKFLGIKQKLDSLPILVNDSEFDLRALPDVTLGNITASTGDSGHGSNCVNVIRDIVRYETPLYIYKSPFSMTQPLKYAAEHGIRIISVSLSKCVLTEEDVEFAKRHRIFIFNSAGNYDDDSATVMEWSDYPFIVGAFEVFRMKMAGYSSESPQLDFSAPTSWDVKLHNGNIISFPGTSSSAPTLAAIGGHLLWKYPYITRDELYQIFMNSCLDVDKPGWDIKSGWGAVSMPEKTIVLTVGNKDMYVNDVKKTKDVAPFIKDDRVFTPARHVAEELGAVVLWNPEKQEVTIVK